ncbi:hypothetical protein TVAG_116170 [Trichomonas vaginalis G3]|uniref:Uncharacterized protein n=1 Tax=Trichomonas vaginalis (strain ATCC PRA-98 / G3) TaxID=412133 RepID=A2EXQ3_TRIV3|nr:hypothetical protein TVAGG3_0222440 [Trichomonas vaginalis G3]EAY02563.1 hypothetical protein TVAG_116170 [Trichomonas vaginalis G3]KAI5552046.1 hypothetical protein TVAGG3_0222440 [Trichomonas vaginalis G3]|eukprot:XP_001330699.1 hypothetical protein [Trichomonas vaginalis G3]
MFGKTSLSLGKKAVYGPTVEEGMLIQDLEVEARNILIDTYNNAVNLFAKEKPIDGLDSFGKKITDLYDDVNRSINHTLLHLANEIDHGNSMIKEARDELDTFHRDYTDSLHSQTFPSPFISRFTDNLQQRSKNLSEAITSYETKLQNNEQAESPAVLVQVLQEQYNAIIRCSARVSEIQRKSQSLHETFKRIFQNKDRKISDLRLDSEENGKQSVVNSVQTAYDEYLEERRRLLEKRDTTTDFSTICAPDTKAGGLFGKSKFSFGSGNSSLNKGTSALSKPAGT